MHRDIKPSNLLVDTDGNAKLLDFGIAKLVGPDGDREAKTRTGAVGFDPSVLGGLAVGVLIENLWLCRP